jgi:methionyl-tRNA formyltransferase
MLGAVRTPIRPGETTGELEARLADLAVPLTLEVITELENGTNQAFAQDESQTTHVGKLTKEDGRIPWEKHCVEVGRHILAMQPWPGPFTSLSQEGRPPLRAKILDVILADGEPFRPPGTVGAVTKEAIGVHCGSGSLWILKLQPDGKRPMTAADFLRGHPVQPGDRFVSERESPPGR